MYHVYPVSRTTVEERTACSKGGVPTALRRIDVYLLGACNTRGARSRRWCRWWGMRGRWGNYEGGMDWSGSMDGGKGDEVISTVW